jgi:hypothetical protein
VEIFWAMDMPFLRVSKVWQQITESCQTESSKGAASGKEATMESRHAEDMRDTLNELLKKQARVLESRSFGVATDTELLEYEIRQEIVHELCNKLARSIAE